MAEMTFEEFCNFLDARENSGSTSKYNTDERKFLWQELGHKADDVRSAILEWVKTGKETDLTISEIVIPKGFWPHHDEAIGKPVSTTLLMNVKKMNYIAAALTIDWIRREPRNAMMVLHRGMK